ncbi:AraC family ligand binding domain-containing protein [Corallococcus carmarthensis]|uniref:AraC family transcriptional regulator n=1 Tax=Corallococcus carmarthensis TaxID=2316728 RepID=A0A3A8JTJ2_9BACT|nr:helix-turn-helix domain-containing protein [Corallococcus carmarthensis]RKG98238.1 AraC family transcriptional regulator [Corallococcus carmarthensis]
MKDSTVEPDFHDHASGQHITSHRHVEGQLLVATEGRMELTLGHRSSWLEPGQAVWVPPGQAHAATALSPTAFRGVLIAEGASALLPSEPRRFTTSPLLLATLPELTAGRTRRRELAAALLMDELLTGLPVLAWPALPRDPRLMELCGRVAEDLCAAPDLDRAALRAGMTRRAFTRRFRADTGHTWGGWLRAARAARAAELLAEGLRVTEAALAVGYTTPSAFSVAFRSVTGVSPVTLMREPRGTDTPRR